MRIYDKHTLTFVVDWFKKFETSEAGKRREFPLASLSSKYITTSVLNKIE